MASKNTSTGHDQESERCRKYHELMINMSAVSVNKETAWFFDRFLALALLKRVHMIHYHECVPEAKQKF